MHIAIASTGEKENSQISSRAARAPFWLIYEDGKLVEVWKNIFSVGGGGAGWSVAKALADKKVDKVIAEKFGDNFVSALEENNIEFQKTTGKIEDNI